MKLFVNLLIVLANCATAFTAVAQVQNNSCSPESFLEVRLEHVKVDAATVIEAWGQVMKQVHAEHPGVAEIAVCFDPVSVDLASTAVPQSGVANLKLDLKDVSVRQLSSTIAELSGLTLHVEVNFLRFSKITSFDGSDRVRHYIYNRYWDKLFQVSSQDGEMDIARKLKNLGVEGRVLKYDAKSGVVSISANSEEHAFLEALLMVARRGVYVKKEK